jgi:hypothetical protein
MAMTKAQREAREENEKILAEAFPNLNPEQITKLQTKLHNLGVKCKENATNLCNIADYQDRRDELRDEVENVIKKFGVSFKYKVTGDPRGLCFKVILPTGRYNSWGGAEDGWGF